MLSVVLIFNAAGDDVISSARASERNIQLSGEETVINFWYIKRFVGVKLKLY